MKATLVREEATVPWLELSALAEGLRWALGLLQGAAATPFSSDAVERPSGPWSAWLGPFLDGCG